MAYSRRLAGTCVNGRAATTETQMALQLSVPDSREKMLFDDPTRTRLLGSIEANRLVLLCGAGLSIPQPSRLMSAVQVSHECYDKYQPISALRSEEHTSELQSLRH